MAVTTARLCYLLAQEAATGARKTNAQRAIIAAGTAATNAALAAIEGQTWPCTRRMIDGEIIRRRCRLPWCPTCAAERGRRLLSAVADTLEAFAEGGQLAVLVGTGGIPRLEWFDDEPALWHLSALVASPAVRGLGRMARHGARRIGTIYGSQLVPTGWQHRAVLAFAVPPGWDAPRAVLTRRRAQVLDDLSWSLPASGESIHAALRRLAALLPSTAWTRDDALADDLQVAVETWRVGWCDFFGRDAQFRACDIRSPLQPPEVQHLDVAAWQPPLPEPTPIIPYMPDERIRYA